MPTCVLTLQRSYSAPCSPKAPDAVERRASDGDGLQHGVVRLERGQPKARSGRRSGSTLQSQEPGVRARGTRVRECAWRRRERRKRHGELATIERLPRADT